MIPQELKNSIIQLAVQGKLVEKRPEEKTGEELYKDIKKKKNDLYESGMFTGKKKTKLLPITRADTLYDIPENWKWIRLGEVSEIFGRIGFRGYTKSDIVPPGKGAITISPSNMSKDGHTYFSDCTYISWDKYEESPDIKVFEGDILIVKTGSSYGKACIVSNLPEKATINPQLAIIKYILCDTQFLQYVLISPMAKTQYETFVIGTSIPTFSQEKLANLLLPLPPLAEQKRIVAKIEELLPLIDRYEKAWNRLEEFNKRFPDDLQKSLLQMAIQGEMVEQRAEEGTGEELYQQIQKEKQKQIQEGKYKKEKTLSPISEEEKVFDIPESWSWVRLSEVCNVSDGTHQTPRYVDNGIPFISAQNVKPYRFIPDVHRDVSYEDYLEYNKVIAPAKGDILMTRVGAGIGEAAIIDQEFEFSIYVSLKLIKSYSDLLDMKYLLNVLNSPLGKSLASKKTLGKGASQGNLNLVFIREFVFPLPPLAEQHRIVAKLEELLPLCEKLKQ